MITRPDTETTRIPTRQAATEYRDDGRTGTYLTDGAGLYRFLGMMGAPGTREVVGIEDCRSLEVILVPAAELSRLGLRRVRNATAAGPAAVAV